MWQKEPLLLGFFLFVLRRALHIRQCRTSPVNIRTRHLHQLGDLRRGSVNAVTGQAPLFKLLSLMILTSTTYFLFFLS
jgi:hypothetical protein